uniref:Secreted protein n=1 Tax=Elaeophora elaphi TaxID=1147741 RepID=A0A0R3RLL8_9BILA
MHYCAVVFLLAFQASVPANGTSQTSKISGKLSREIDIPLKEQKMQIFLDELKICKERGEKMTAIITDNQTITITQNSSLHSVTNLTKSTTEFNITLKDVVISNSQCEGMVLDATLNYTEVGILLLCYKNDEIVEWNDLEKKLIYSLHPSDPDRNSNKLNIIRYHFIPNEIEQEEKEAEEENENRHLKFVRNTLHEIAIE